MAFGLSLVSAIALLPSFGRTDTVDSSSSGSPSMSMTYDFRVYALNCTSRSSTPDGTVFKFNEADLPFDFSTVCFGDFRSDTTFSHTYYAGSGILVNASGANAVITLRDNTGGIVCKIGYHGQAQVVFNGMVESMTYPTNVTTYSGTDQIVQAWKNLKWAPNDGLLVEHPLNVSLADAKFYVMTLEPSGTVEVPEFSLPPIVCALIALFLVVRIIKAASADIRTSTDKL